MNILHKDIPINVVIQAIGNDILGMYKYNMIVISIKLLKNKNGNSQENIRKCCHVRQGLGGC